MSAIDNVLLVAFASRTASGLSDAAEIDWQPPAIIASKHALQRRHGIVDGGKFSDRNIAAIKGAYLARRGDATCEQDGAEMKKSLLAFAAFVAVTLPYAAHAQFFRAEERPHFHEFIVKQHHPSFRYKEEVRVGVILPEVGVEFHDVPGEYHVRPGYRYAVVNDHVVIVDPRTRRIEEIIE
jgi:Protein of unknown function (DUF1236)